MTKPRLDASVKVNTAMFEVGMQMAHALPERRSKVSQVFFDRIRLAP